MGEIDYGLPKNYRAVEYLESTSEKQWFDTGIKASSTLTVEGEWYIDRSTIADDYVIFTKVRPPLVFILLVYSPIIRHHLIIGVGRLDQGEKIFKIQLTMH